MTDKLKALMKSFASSLDFPGPIYEFGALQTKGQEKFADLRPLFPGKTYVGCDMRPGSGVDKVLDACDTGLEAGSAGSLVCLEMLEHCQDPWKACREFHRILAPGGFAVVSVPFNHPIHAHPSDYWRFTQEGLKLLLADFAHVVTGQTGDALSPEGVAAVAWKSRPAPDAAGRAAAVLESWDELRFVRHRSVRSRIRDFVPVGLVNLYRERNGERRI
jgi:SAM-dependent methyltransferase